MGASLLRGLFAAGLLVLWPGTPAVMSAVATSAVDTPKIVDASGRHHRREERLYRINGQVRLLLLWAGRDDVGSARLQWESADGQSALTLLAGSDPARAPNRLNQWIFLREESRPTDARVFALRSLTDAESASDPAAADLDGPQFGASCTAMTPSGVRSAATTVTAGRGLTAARFAVVLDQVAAAGHWTAKRSPRPEGVHAGFLTALDYLLTAASAADGHDGSDRGAWPRVASYFYNNVPYDLELVRVRDSGPATFDGTAYAVLRVADLAVHNRRTRHVTRFTVTYAPAATCTEPAPATLPVRIVYQPNWWLKIELRLDRDATAPPDPASQGETLARIDRLCDRVTQPPASDTRALP